MRERGPLVPVPHRVVSRRRETSDTWTLELEAVDSGDRLDRGDPGQFNMVYAFGSGEVPISISGADDGRLVHTVRDVGAVTRLICAAESGAVLGVRGPFGSRWPLTAAEGSDLVVVAGGLGLAPLRSSVLAALAEPERFPATYVLYGGREPEQLLYSAELESWRRLGIRVSLIVDSGPPEWDGNVGVVTKLIDRADFDPDRAVALVCGPEAMMRFSARSLRARGVDPARIHLSLERSMKCAVAQCGRCQLGPTLMCRDGAVLPLSDVGPWMGVREL